MVTSPHIEQIPTSHHYSRDGYQPLQIVIHTMECPMDVGRAEWCARYFQGSVQASAHFELDPETIVQSVALDQGAWACPYFNHSGIQIEHAGYAATADWGSDEAGKMLALSAQLSAWLCDTYDIPVRHLSLDEVRKGTVKGFLGHGDATAAGVGGNTHTDPGENFPWDHYLDLVRGYLGLGGGGSDAPIHHKPPTHHKPKPSSGKLTEDGRFGLNSIKAWQHLAGTTQDGLISSQPDTTEPYHPALLNVQYVTPSKAKGSQLIAWVQKRTGAKADGLYGPASVKATQRHVGVKADGYFGPHTARAVQHALNEGKF